MEEFLQDLASTYWWLLLIVTLGVGIIGTFMADGIKKAYGLISSRQRERNLEYEKKFEEDIEFLLIHPDEIIHWKIDALYHGQRATVMVILCVILIVISNGFVSVMEEGFQMIIGIVFLLLAYLPGYKYALARRQSGRLMKISRYASRGLQELEEAEEGEIPF